ncbi:MAG: ABC transporter permease, partial [Propionicimonas sp.]
MAAYIGRRLLQVVPMLLLVSLVVFLMIQAAPYDVVDSITTPNMSAETVEIIRQRYGLDDPILVQYVRWLGNVLSGDLGYSLVSQYSITADLAVKIPNTVLLVVPAYLTALALAIGLGLWAGANHGGRVDRIIDGASAIGLATPPFWFALVVIYVLGYYLNLFPIIGMHTVGSEGDPVDLLRHFVMPYLVLTVAFAPDLTRYVRSSTV